MISVPELSLAAVAGLVASFHVIVYAYGRNIYSLSRAGYFRRSMSITHPTRKTLHVALVVGAVAGYAVALAIEYGEQWFGAVPVGGVLLDMAVFGAVIAYVMQMAAYWRIKSMTQLSRPYISPLGRSGAVVAGAIAAVTLIFLFINPDYTLPCMAWRLGSPFRLRNSGCTRDIESSSRPKKRLRRKRDATPDASPPGGEAFVDRC